MAKEAYYFSHDANARHDPNICEMISVYGMQGYGWYWVIVEMLREQEDYRLKLCKRNAIAMQMQCDKDAAHKFVLDCINEFELFETDDEFFWSNSLIKRMEKRDEKSQKARESARKRWENANAMQTQCDGNALKEKKGKEIKEKEKKAVVKETAAAEIVSEVDNETKLIIKTFNQEIGRLITPNELTSLSAWIDEGMELELILETIKKARAAGVPTLKYMTGILNKCHGLNIFTLAAMQLDDEMREQNKANSPMGGQRVPKAFSSLDNWEKERSEG